MTEAHRLHEQVLQLRRRVLGKEHPHTVDSKQRVAEFAARLDTHQSEGPDREP
ncbi:tetratricopeptide repeat protein [Micromonospora sp. MH99]|uniref:tetratricopeptide repeat protein n=1 Tax=Micromonospora sp. MH99 TaxID=1945510 RepID=UPI0035A827BE